MEPDSRPAAVNNEFTRAGQGLQPSFGKEIYLFIKENKKWWLIPIFLALAVFGLLVALGSTGAAPFIYTVF